MAVSVIGHHMDVGESLRGHAEAELARVFEKYFGGAIEAKVVMSKESSGFRATIQAHIGKNIRLEARGQGDTAYPAFDEAAERLAKRLRRHKRRLRDDHHQRGHHLREDVRADKARYLVLAGEGPGSEALPAEEEEEVPTAGAEEAPLVVAEMETEIATLSVSDAVMRLDLADLPVLLFRRAGDEHLNLVYRRKDGNIGWIDPEGGKA